jgi:hypothetical protein
MRLMLVLAGPAAAARPVFEDGWDRMADGGGWRAAGLLLKKEQKNV